MADITDKFVYKNKEKKTDDKNYTGNSTLLFFADKLERAISGSSSYDVFVSYHERQSNSDVTSARILIIKGRKNLFNRIFGRKILESNIMACDDNVLNCTLVSYNMDCRSLENVLDVSNEFNKKHNLNITEQKSGLVIYKVAYR
jgi:hypothetical protein